MAGTAASNAAIYYTNSTGSSDFASVGNWRTNLTAAVGTTTWLPSSVVTPSVGAAFIGATNATLNLYFTNASLRTINELQVGTEKYPYSTTPGVSGGSIAYDAYTGGPATLTLSNGASLYTAANMVIGQGRDNVVDNSGTVVVNEGALLWVTNSASGSRFLIGFYDNDALGATKGTLIINGGTVRHLTSSGRLNLGGWDSNNANNYGRGFVLMSSGLFETVNSIIGAGGGYGQFDQSGGTNLVTGFFTTAAGTVRSNVSSVYNLSGSGVLNVLGDFTLRENGTVGTLSNCFFNQSGGIVALDGGNTKTIGRAGAGRGKGIYNLSGGTLDIRSGAGDLVVGGSSTGASGELNISGTGNLISTNGRALVLARTQTSTGLVNQVSGTVELSVISTGLLLGDSGTGARATYNLNGGTLTLGTLTASANSASNIFNFGGGTLKANQSLNVAVGANFATIVNGGGATIDSDGNTVTWNPALVAGTGSGGLTKVGAGTLSLNATNTYAGATTISGGTLSLDGVALLGGGAYAGNITNNGDLTYNSSSAQTFSGGISGAGTLTKQNNAGTLSLSGANTYSGATTVADGKLKVVVGGSAVNSATTVNDVSGAVLGVVINNNTKQWTNGALTFAGFSSAVEFDYGYVVPSGSLAPLRVVGNVDFTGTPTVTVKGFAIPSGNNTYPLMTWTGSQSGTPPTSVVLPPRFNGALSISGNTLYLMVTNLSPLTWNTTSGTWDINTTPNWKDSSGTPGQVYLENVLPGDRVVFDNTPGAGSYTVTISSLVTPESVVVNNTTANYTLTGAAIDGTTGLTKSGAGSLTLATANTYLGETTLSAGQLNLNDAGAIGSGALTITGGTLGNTAGALTLSGNNAQNWNGDFTFAGTQDLNLGTGAVTSSGDRQVTVSANVLTIGGVIGGLTNLTKAGAGTLALTAVQTYTGATTISGGTLAIEGAGRLGGGNHAGNIANSGSLVIGSTANQILSGVLAGGGTLTKQSSGTLTLSGLNTYNGATTIGGGKLVGLVGASSASSAMTVSDTVGAILGISITDNTKQWTNGGVTFAGANAAIEFDFGSVVPSTTVAPLVVSGNVAYTGTPTVTIKSSALPVTVGTYPLMTWTGSASGPAPTAVTLPVRFGGALTVVGSTLFVTVTNFAPISWNTASGDWDIDATANWKDASGATGQKYLQPSAPGDKVLFDDSTSAGPGSYNVNVVSTVQPGSVVVSNSAVTYSIDGAAIAGSTTLTKSGSGALTLTAVNTFSGATTINAGSVTIGGAGRLGNGTYAQTIANNGAFIYNSSQAQTLSGAISGTGSLTKQDGTSTLTMSGSNTYSGVTTIDAGTITLNTTNALGTPAGGTTVNATGILNLNGQAIGAEPLTLNGGLLQNNSGTVVASGPVTLSGNSTVGGTATLILSGSISGAGTLDKVAAGTTELAVSNNLTGTVTVAAGTLTASHPYAFGLTNQVVAAANATQLQLTNDITLSTNISIVMNTGPGATAPFRSALRSLSGTNTVNGSIEVNGDGIAQFNSGNAPGILNLNGDINGTNSIVNTVVFRGPSGVFSGNINGRLNCPGAAFSVTDNPIWQLNSTGHVYGAATIVYGTLRLGVNNALTMTNQVLLGQNNGTASHGQLDLNGFNQKVMQLVINPAAGASQATVGNSSTTADSLLTIDGGGSAPSLLTTSGRIQDSLSGGTRKVAVEIVSDSLTLAAANNTYSGNTTIRSSGTLFLTGAGNLPNTAVIDVQAGGTFDVAGRTTPFTVASVTTLQGNGTVNGAITNSGTVAPGASIGILTANNDVTLAAGGTALMEVNNATSTNDLLNVGGALNYGGTLVISNLSVTAYTNGQTIKLFNAASYSGSFAALVPATPETGLAWNTNNLTVDGSVQVVVGVNTSPTNIVSSVSGNQLTLSWPASHIGWTLQTQTNQLNVGLFTNWTAVAGSAVTNQMIMTINPADPSVFFRLVYP